jgi:hypothetical protein
MQSNENNENDIGSEENIINEIWRYKAAKNIAGWRRLWRNGFGISLEKIGLK